MTLVITAVCAGDYCRDVDVDCRRYGFGSDCR